MKYLSLIGFVFMMVCAGHAVARPTLAYATKEGLEFTNDDKDQASPGNYFALLCAVNGCKLQAARLSNESTKVYVYANGEEDGYRQRSNVRGALAFISGIPGLKEGPVKTWYFQPFHYSEDEPNQLAFTSPRWSKIIDVGGMNLSIRGQRVEKALRECSTCEPGAGVIWKMTMGAIERTLVSLPDNSVEGPGGQVDVNEFLVWVGDLDGDGKPDLLIRPQSRSSGVYLQLFLSTKLQASKPWKPSAEFSYWPLWDPGC
jgi:hypothetical protein